VATVGPGGLITARSVGSTEITITHGAVSERIEVTVSDDLDEEVAAFAGDLNRDGQVDSNDIDEVVHRVFAGAEADVNRDERTSAGDIVAIVAKASGAALFSNSEPYRGRGT
jgi:hypothetical protein